MRYISKLTNEELKSLLFILTQVPEEGFVSIEITRRTNEIELYGVVDWKLQDGNSIWHTTTGITYYLTDFHLDELFGIDIPEDKFLFFMRKRFGFGYTLNRFWYTLNCIVHNIGRLLLRQTGKKEVYKPKLSTERMREVMRHEMDKLTYD